MSDVLSGERQTIQYANLSNGIELMPGGRFVRIQSTACEQKRWSFIIADLDNDFLLHLAMGYHCIVYDCGHNGEPRALWQGLPWIRYVLERMWLRQSNQATVRGHRVDGYFAEQYGLLTPRAKRKLRYFRKFLSTTEIALEGCWFKTEHDGDYPYYCQLLREKLVP